MKPSEQIEQAFLHLCWAIKLDSYLKCYPPARKVYFDNPQCILDPNDPFDLPGEQFKDVLSSIFG